MSYRFRAVDDNPFIDAIAVVQRWQERQLDLYLQAKAIDELTHQRVLAEYQSAQSLEQLEQQTASLSTMAHVLANVDSGIGVVEADLARLVAVADSALPAIVNHVGLAAARLAGIEELLANPAATAAGEQTRLGSRALASASELAADGVPELADEWLEQAVVHLSQAVETYQHHAESWHLLALALQQRGDARGAAHAYSRCALYAVREQPELSAWALLMAAGVLRTDLGQPAESAALLRKYLKPLDRCAELHLSLVVHHGEVDHLDRALSLAPMMAADARIHEVPTVEQVAAVRCLDEDGPVARLRQLERKAATLADTAKTADLQAIGEVPPPLDLPEPGVDALLRAFVCLPVAVATAEQLVSDVTEGLRNLQEAAVRADAAARHAHRTSAQAVDVARTDVERQLLLFDQEIFRAAEEIRQAEESLSKRRAEALKASVIAREEQRLADYWVDLLPWWMKRFPDDWETQHAVRDQAAELPTKLDRADALWEVAQGDEHWADRLQYSDTPVLMAVRAAARASQRADRVQAEAQIAQSQVAAVERLSYANRWWAEAHYRISARHTLYDSYHKRPPIPDEKESAKKFAKKSVPELEATLVEDERRTAEWLDQLRATAPTSEAITAAVHAAERSTQEATDLIATGREDVRRVAEAASREAERADNERVAEAEQSAATAAEKLQRTQQAVLPALSDLIDLTRTATVYEPRITPKATR